MRALLAVEVRQIARQLKVKIAGASPKSELHDRSSRGNVSPGNHSRRVLGQYVAKLDDASKVDSVHVSDGLSYMTDDVKAELARLPKFNEVLEGWISAVGDSLKAFHFVDLHAYLVESRDKTFDAQSMRAFKSLKGYKYFVNGFVQNMWMKKFADSDIVYVRAFVFQSLTLDTPLEVFIALNSACGDVYDAQCYCVSGAGEACSHNAAPLFAVEELAKL